MNEWMRKLWFVIFVHAFLLSTAISPSWAADTAEETPLTSTFRKEDFTQGNFDFIIEEGEIATITGFINIRKAFVLSPELARVSIDTPLEVSVTGIAVGSTYIHIWDDTGTTTLRVNIRRKGYRSDSLARGERSKRRKGTPIRIKYSYTYNDRKMDYKQESREDWKAIDRAQRLSVSGDTPYGLLDTDISYLFKKDPSSEKKEDIDRIKTKFSNRFFDISGGDLGVSFTDLTLPITHIQGIRFRSPRQSGFPGIGGVKLPKGLLKKVSSGEKKPFKTEIEYDFVAGQTGYSLWGSELSSFGQGKNIFYGVQTTIKPRDDFSVFAVGLRSGDKEDDTVTTANYLGGIGAKYRIGEYLKFDIETAQNNKKRTAFTSSLDLNIDKLSVGAKYRDVTVDYLNVVGSAPYKGKRGVYTKAMFKPVNVLSLSAKFDVYQNRLSPDPDSVEKGNKDFSCEAKLSCPPTKTHFSASYYHKHNKAQQYPILTFGQQFQVIQPLEGVPLLGNLKGELIYRMSKYKSFTTDASNYKDENLIGRLTAYPIKGLSFYVAETLNFREWFTRTDDYKTTPRRFTAGMGYSSRIGELPVSVTFNLGYQKDTRINEDKSSSIGGEDMLTGSAYVRYSITPSLSGFFRMSVGNMEGVVNSDLDRLSTQMYTGLTWDWDTGLVAEGYGTIKGYVFKDVNRNEVMDKGDIPLKGAKIIVDKKRAALTDSKGFYRIKYVKRGQRNAALDLTTIPEKYVSTTPLNVLVDIDRMDVKEVNFGIAPRATVEGFIFNDINRNNVFDEGVDEVMSNMLVKVDDGTGGFTLGGGHFVIRAVSLGERTVTVEKTTIPEGLMQGPPFTHKVQMKEGDTKEVEFMIYAPRFVAGSVYIDKNENMEFDEGEGVSGVKLTLIDKVVITDEDGFYIFRDLPAGSEEMLVDKTTIPKDYRLKKDKIEAKIPKEPFGKRDLNIELITGPDTAPQKAPSLRGLTRPRPS